MKIMLLVLPMILAGCGVLADDDDDKQPEAEEVIDNMRCIWVEDMQECFCYSPDADGFTWAPAIACVVGNGE